MKLYSLRAMDYFRMMSAKDRRYLLFNPIIKSKVTREGDKVLRLIMDVVYAQLILEAATLYDVEEELVDQIFAHFIRSTASNALAQINSQKSSDVQDDCFWNIAKVVLTVDKESFHTITVFANVLERMAAKQNNIDFLAVSYGELVAAVSDVYKTNVVCVEVCPADE